MAKKKVSDYVDELKEMIVERTGKYDAWLSVQVRMTAMNMVILDKLQDELADAELTTSMTGSMGQQKIEVNPLIDKYNATRQYALILATQGEILPAPVAAGDAALDITDDLLLGLNEEYIKTKDKGATAEKEIKE